MLQGLPEQDCSWSWPGMALLLSGTQSRADPSPSAVVTTFLQWHLEALLLLLSADHPSTRTHRCHRKEAFPAAPLVGLTRTGNQPAAPVRPSSSEAGEVAEREGQVLALSRLSLVCSPDG